jgi:hypothetical protein
MLVLPVEGFQPRVRSASVIRSSDSGPKDPVSGSFRVLLARKNPLGGDKEIARFIRNRLRHRFDAVAPVLRDEAFDPLPVIAIKDQVFRASDNEAVEVEDFRAFAVR